MDATGNIFDRNPKLRFLKRFVEINNILMAIMGFILLYFRTGISPHKTPSKPVSTPLEGAMI